MDLSWIPLIVCVLGFALHLYRHFKATLPRPLADGTLMSWEQTQARYDAVANKSLVYLANGPIILAVALVLNGALPARTYQGDNLLLGFTVFLFALLAMVLIIQVLAAKMEAKIGKNIPALADSVASVKMRAVLWLSIAIPFGLMLLAIQGDDLIWIFGFDGLALVLLVLRSRLLTKYLIRQRVRLAEDDPLVVRLKAIFEHEGVTPKHFILTRSATANGMVLPSGVIAVTTALRWLLSEDEIVAVMVHELSHYRDKDPKRFRLIGAGSYFGPFLVFVGMGYILLPNMHIFAIVPALVGLLLALLPVSRSITGRAARQAEFKCDRAAIAAGYGPELASGLDKAARYMGHPFEWSPIHALLLTHPSYKARFALLAPQRTPPKIQ